MEQLHTRRDRSKFPRHIGQRRAPFDRAAILAARHDFLPWVAALAEIHAAEHIEIDHLRHELLDHRLGNPRLARTNIEPVPHRRRGAREFAVEERQTRLNLSLRPDPQVTQLPERIRHADQRTGGPVHLHMHAIGQCIEYARQRLAHIARQAHHRQFAARIRELRFSAQHEHRQTFLHGGLDVLRHQQADRLAAAPVQKRRQQTPLGRTVARQTRIGRIEMLGIVGQLTVQEACRVVAGRIDHAELRERHIGAVRADSVEFFVRGTRQRGERDR